MQPTIIDINDFMKYPYKYDNPISSVWFSKHGKSKVEYLEIYCGFDIETYTTESHNAYMYIWQFSIYSANGNFIFTGRTWQEFVDLINLLIYDLNLSKERRIIIGVANLSYEHQFMKRWFVGRWTKVFAKEKRQPMIAIIDDCVEFRDVLQISGGSLSDLAKQYTQTQKLKGDLDYTIPRTRFTKLTPQELQYCYNDVAIVSEFMQYLFNKYIKPDKWIPTTKTGLLRREVKNAMKSRGNGVKRDIMREIYRCYPKDYNLYSELMQYCFRGGYCHANIRHVGHIVNDCKSYDITSSYPFTMLSFDGFPVSPLKAEKPANFETLYNADKYCLFFRVIFTNLKATTDHAIESKSKCITISNNAIIDNGRIRFCTQCEMIITNLDFDIINLFYKYDSYKIVWVYSSVRGRLPKYLIMPLAKAYEEKAKLKKSGKSKDRKYALTKSLVNSAYGMTVTRLVTSEIKMTDISCEWYSDDTCFNYDKEREKAFLLPQWGIYVCAYSRYRILMAIHEIGKDACYSDTDSIKFIGEHDDYFSLVNKQTSEIMKDVCKRYNLNYKWFDDLGQFEPEYNGQRFQAKFLGAKRYITKVNGVYETTIAGLPKNALKGYIDRLKLQHDIYNYGKYPDMFSVFENKMFLNAEVSLKNAHTYNDIPHENIIDGVKCQELSSVGIYSIDFTMKLSDFYLTLIQQELEERKNYETRIY